MWCDYSICVLSACNLYGVITLYGKGRSNVFYHDGRTDSRIRSADLRPIPVARNAPTPRIGTWREETYVVDYTDRGGVDSSNVVVGKRNRSSHVNYK